MLLLSQFAPLYKEIKDRYRQIIGTDSHLGVPLNSKSKPVRPGVLYTFDNSIFGPCNSLQFPSHFSNGLMMRRIDAYYAV